MTGKEHGVSRLDPLYLVQVVSFTHLARELVLADQHLDPAGEAPPLVRPSPHCRVRAAGKQLAARPTQPHSVPGRPEPVKK
jgi:hypothetical protein